LEGAVGHHVSNIKKTPIMTVDGVHKTYVPMTYFGLGRKKARERASHALIDINLSIYEGEIVGLLGPNGAGKTTLLKTMTNLIHPSSGSVSLHGRDIMKHSRWARRQMGLITCDERSFYWRLSGRQNIEFFASLYGVSKRDMEIRMEELFDTLGLTYAADRPYHTYSSGMKQKLAIARGHIVEPSILFYDEPTRSLDPVSAARIRNWIEDKRIRSPEQVHVIATNHLYEAEQLCDRVFIINHGRLVAQGTIEEICKHWNVSNAETHVIEVAGFTNKGDIAADPENGLLDVGEAYGMESELVLTLQVDRHSDALSRSLRKIIDGGGTVLRCHCEQEPFDKVFYSVLGVEQEVSSTPQLESAP
jgi:ABC-2 type transport system ATP-binding protein